MTDQSMDHVDWKKLRYEKRFGKYLNSSNGKMIRSKPTPHFKYPLPMPPRLPEDKKPIESRRCAGSNRGWDCLDSVASGIGSALKGLAFGLISIALIFAWYLSGGNPIISAACFGFGCAWIADGLKDCFR